MRARSALPSLLEYNDVIGYDDNVASSSDDNWKDCGLPNATMHFDNLISSSPVHRGDRLEVNKTFHFDDTYAFYNPRKKSQKGADSGINGTKRGTLSILYRQFWKPKIHIFNFSWLKFLQLSQNACPEDVPELCPPPSSSSLLIPAGKKITVHSLHPKLNPLSPYGLYRSLQQYYFHEDGDEGSTGKLIGCIDMVMVYDGTARTASSRPVSVD